MTTLNVTVSRVAYPPATAETENWYILLTDIGVCKGRISWRPRENEQLILDGENSVYKGSKEFAFKSARLDVPTNSRDQLRYVCNRTQGLGPAAESLIWEQMGAKWMDVSEGVVPRLTGKVYQNFRVQLESLRDKSEEVKVVAALLQVLGYEG